MLFEAEWSDGENICWLVCYDFRLTYIGKTVDGKWRWKFGVEPTKELAKEAVEDAMRFGLDKDTDETVEEKEPPTILCKKCQGEIGGIAGGFPGLGLCLKCLIKER